MSRSNTWKSIHIAAHVGGSMLDCDPTRGKRASRPRITSFNNAHAELKPRAVAPYSLKQAVTLLPVCRASVAWRDLPDDIVARERRRLQTRTVGQSEERHDARAKRKADESTHGNDRFGHICFGEVELDGFATVQEYNHETTKRQQ
jgi:hypothetical protein